MLLVVPRQIHHTAISLQDFSSQAFYFFTDKTPHSLYVLCLPVWPLSHKIYESLVTVKQDLKREPKNYLFCALFKMHKLLIIILILLLINLHELHFMVQIMCNVKGITRCEKGIQKFSITL